MSVLPVFKDGPEDCRMMYVPEALKIIGIPMVPAVTFREGGFDTGFDFDYSEYELVELDNGEVAVYRHCE